MAKSYRERIGELLDILRKPLAEYAITRFTGKFDDDWKQAVIDYLGSNKLHNAPDDPVDWDIQAWMHTYLGAWKDIFSHTLSNSDRSLLFELKEVRNDWAHQQSFEYDRTYRAYDDADLFLQAINSPVAETVHGMKEDLQRERFSQPKKRVVAKIKVNPQGNLKPWRETAIPHEDVRNGTFSLAEFAADLWEVHKTATGGVGSVARSEYSDPKEFFSRTYLTEGLTHLIDTGVRRLAGAGGEPVVELQTNFGGGKTHSMLALYHLASGVKSADLPEMDEFISSRGLSLPSSIRRAVIVGNKIDPATVDRKPDGTAVHTLWGEIAWQLGGKVGYDMIREADLNGTNPGDALTGVLRRYAPVVILIDEWVAYARQLFDRTTMLPSGTFDTQFTFAQTLTESVRSADRCLLVISLPQSIDQLGSEGGQEALTKLQNVIGRVESTWQPATQDEAYEIVRRRLFESTIDPQARGGVVKAFMHQYNESPSAFPPRTREKEYEERLNRTYPLHPELFDHLYHNWSTIPRFQQTRGVLRLMASVIHSLWVDEDKSLMIMPGTIPLDDSTVRSQFTTFLGTGWNNIIESEIDGENSVAVTVDRSNVNMGQVAAGRRVARTLFLATSPLEQAAQQGVDTRTVAVGSVQPGEKPPVFIDAIGHIARESVYLYSENERYWYSERPTLRKLAEDRKLQNLENRTELLDTLTSLLRKSPKITEKADFARLHISPRSASEVADTHSVGLVVISPDEPHIGNSGGSPAMVRAQALLDSRGTGPRINKNALIFTAADETRLESLLDAVASHLAWTSIVYDADTRGTMEGVTKGQINAARAEADTWSRTIQVRIEETYRWLLVPQQASPQTPIVITEHRINAAKPIAQKAIELLYKNEWLFTVMDGRRLRLELDQVPLWKDHTVSVANLIEYFARYVYLPRIASPSVITGAVEEGVGQMTWNPETFALAKSYDADAQRFHGLVAGTLLIGIDVAGSVLVQPEIAQKQIDVDTVKPDVVTPPIPPTVDPGPPGHGPVAPPKPPERRMKRFFGTVNLDPLTPSGKMGTIADEILVHLTTAGAKVRLHLEIEAEDPVGFPEGVIRTVSENATTLGFDEKGFEEE